MATREWPIRKYFWRDRKREIPKGQDQAISSARSQPEHRNCFILPIRGIQPCNDIIYCCFTLKMKIVCFCTKLETRINEKFAGNQITLQDIRSSVWYQSSPAAAKSKVMELAQVLTSDVLWFGLCCINKFKEIEIPPRNIRKVEGGSFNIPGQYGGLKSRL